LIRTQLTQNSTDWNDVLDTTGIIGALFNKIRKNAKIGAEASGVGCLTPNCITSYRSTWLRTCWKVANPEGLCRDLIRAVEDEAEAQGDE